MSCGLTPGRNLPHNQIIMMLVIAWGCSKLSKSHEASEETELSGINGSLGCFIFLFRVIRGYMFSRGHAPFSILILMMLLVICIH